MERWVVVEEDDAYAEESVSSLKSWGSDVMVVFVPCVMVFFVDWSRWMRRAVRTWVARAGTDSGPGRRRKMRWRQRAGRGGGAGVVCVEEDGFER